ncbi:MAG: enoyl-CoA hydratase/isomerase family protein [Desulfobacteraceae bacterium]|nr:enoyl-CoA hydratase/isomerase family protein [Desulfobacteraceae bacterium]MBC2754870.1 enoyl-CoA hydratase/isomerase family protein [Desulfobacteraceae bacterium]
MSEEGILLERKGKIAIVTINRPQRRNAFNEHMFLELARVTGELKKNLPRAIVITGGGESVFSAGFDVNPDNPWVAKLINSVETSDSAPAEQLIGQLRKIVDGFVSLPVPIISALNGLTYGGGAELAVRCDLRVMDPDAVICFSEVRLGLMPDWGGGATLAHLIGPSRAADMILTARKVAAGEAINLGLVNRISRLGECLDEAVRLAEMISQNGPRAVSYALNVIRQSQNQSLNRTLDLEADKAVSLIVSGECFYGVAAFLEKKEPEFPDVDFGSIEE